MARVYRLAFLLLLLVAGTANAALSPLTVYTVGGSTGSTAQAACTGKAISALVPPYDVGQVFGTLTGTNKSLCDIDHGGVFSGRFSVTSSAVCPANSTGTSSCTCSSGYIESGQSCVVDPSAVCASMNASPTAFLSSAFSLSGCAGGVNVRASMVTPNGSGGGWLFPPFSCSGTCTGSTVSSGTQDLSTCKLPQVAGTFNGQTVCYTPSTATAAGPSATASNPAGAASNPTSGLGPDAPPTATGKSSETTCKSGSCTTTTTFTNGSGASVGTKTDTKPQLTFCQENAGSPLCKQSSYAASSCNAAPACDGDAIQCGIAFSAWKTQCALNPSADDNSARFDAEKGKAGSQVPDGGSVAISPTSFSTANAITGGGSGLSDLSITVWKTPVTLPLSTLNSYLAAMGNVLMAVAFIISIRILRGNT